MTDLELQKDLRKHHVYTSWQFIQYTRKNIEIVEYCAKILELLVAKMENKTVRWEQHIFNDLVEQITPAGKRLLTKSVTVDDLPDYDIRVVGEKVDSWFLFDKLVRDFYQYSMNAFDSISQIANAGLLANRSKAYDSTDFQRMCDTFSKVTYRDAFPLTSNWFATVCASTQYKYIEAVNNRTKHTGDIANKLAMGLLGSDSNTKIGPFFRKSAQHETKELSDQLWATIEFVKESWETFMDAFEREYILDVFVDGRLEGIDGVYQQKMEDSQNFAYAYIKTNLALAQMPDEIYVLLTKEREDRVVAHESTFDRILVQGQGNHEILGRYLADEEIGIDCLFHYRKYRKDTEHEGDICMMLEALDENVQFYHWNEFFDITTISDDDNFKARVSSFIG